MSTSRERGRSLFSVHQDETIKKRKDKEVLIQNAKQDYTKIVQMNNNNNKISPWSPGASSWPDFFLESGVGAADTTWHKEQKNHLHSDKYQQIKRKKNNDVSVEVQDQCYGSYLECCF